MKLYHSPTSPYARKTRICVIERGLSDQVELVAINPMEAGAEHKIPNPLGRIPTLVLNDGRALFDSPVICAYLDTLGDAPPLMGTDDASRWNAQRAQALGDGVMDAAFNIVVEGRRTDAEQSRYWVERWTASIERSVAAMEQDITTERERFDVGLIAYTAALGYLDFRLPHIDWRAANPALARWFEQAGARPSVSTTAPAP